MSKIKQELLDKKKRVDQLEERRQQLIARTKEQFPYIEKFEAITPIVPEECGDTQRARKIKTMIKNKDLSKIDFTEIFDKHIAGMRSA